MSRHRTCSAKRAAAPRPQLPLNCPFRCTQWYELYWTVDYRDSTDSLISFPQMAYLPRPLNGLPSCPHWRAASSIRQATQNWCAFGTLTTPGPSYIASRSGPAACGLMPFPAPLPSACSASHSWIPPECAWGSMLFSVLGNPYTCAC
jgi:hypothetical protein